MAENDIMRVNPKQKSETVSWNMMKSVTELQSLVIILCGFVVVSDTFQNMRTGVIWPTKYISLGITQIIWSGVVWIINNIYIT